MATAERRISVDASVFVNLLTGGGVDKAAWLPASRNLLRAAENGQFDVFISAITIAEVFGAGAVRGNHLANMTRRENVTSARRWLTDGRFKVVEADASLTRAAAELAAAHQLAGADAVVLASAIRAQSEALYTWDNDLLKVGDAILGLSVVTPERAPIVSDLFSSLETPT